MLNDDELLRQYLNGSEAAFTEFVKRHIGLVYSAALRRVGSDRTLAEEITQTIFIQCARKARILQSHPTLSGWLHRSTRFAAIDALRAQQTRQTAEQADQLSAEIAGENRSTWVEIRPQIDALLDRLSDHDREAILLRFFEGVSYATIAKKLSVSEDAARMRVDRALHKLRQALARRGFTSTAVALSAVLGEHAAIAAPAGLSAAVSAGTLATAPAGSAAGLFGATTLLMSKVPSIAIVATAAVGLIAVAVESKANLDLDRQIAEASRTDSTAIVATAATARLGVDHSSELTRLKERIAELKSRPDGVADSAIIKVSDLRNAGQTTPEAAFETMAWAIINSQYDVAAECMYLGKTKAAADRYFASLPAEVQAKYRTPERLYTRYLVANVQNSIKFDAIQVIELIPGDRPDDVQARVWFHGIDGSAHIALHPLTRFGNSWKMGNRSMEWSLPHAIGWLREHEGLNLPDLPSSDP